MPQSRSQLLRQFIDAIGFKTEPGTCADAFENDELKLLHVPDLHKADDSDFAYYSTLHEIGHAYTAKDIGLADDDYFNNEVFGSISAKMGECEAAAWQWAFAHDPYQKPEGYAECYAALEGYKNSMNDPPGPRLTAMMAEAKVKRGEDRWTMDACLKEINREGLGGDIPSLHNAG